jgi:hypothetical protein
MRPTPTAPPAAGTSTRAHRVAPPRTAHAAPPVPRRSPGGDRFIEHLARASRSPVDTPHVRASHDAAHSARLDRPGSAASQPVHEGAAPPSSSSDSRAPRDRAAVDADPALLAPFMPLPAVLTAPPGALPIATRARPSPPQEVAALAERVLRSLRVGTVGRHGHEVRLQLRLEARSHVEVRLCHSDGALEATVIAGTGDPTDVARLADAIRRELDARGIVCASFQVNTD